MRAYLRQDGLYDVYPASIEPQVMSAQELEGISRREGLKARRLELMQELEAIETELNLQAAQPEQATQPEQISIEDTVTPMKVTRW